MCVIVLLLCWVLHHRRPGNHCDYLLIQRKFGLVGWSSYLCVLEGKNGGGRDEAGPFTESLTLSQSLPALGGCVARPSLEREVQRQIRLDLRALPIYMGLRVFWYGVEVGCPFHGLGRVVER